MAVPKLEDVAKYSFIFDLGKYPARNIYKAAMSSANTSAQSSTTYERSGKTAEEFRCALAIDAYPKVKHWVRNIDQQPQTSFWLPTSSDYFYPDFVAELTNGRVLVVECKGEPYKTNDDSKEKAPVGFNGSSQVTAAACSCSRRSRTTPGGMCSNRSMTNWAVHRATSFRGGGRDLPTLAFVKM